MNVPPLYQIMKINPPLTTPGVSMPKKALQNHPDGPLVRKLLNRYPDLKYINTSYSGYGGDATGQNSYIFSFISQQKRLIQKGYTEEKAFEIVEKKFQARFSEKIEAAQIATRLVMNNNARSLLSLTQQQAEKEAILKVRRMTRDIPLFKEAQEAQEKTLRDLVKETEPETKASEVAEEQEFNEEDFEEYSDLEADEKSVDPAEQYEEKYTRILHKIVPELKENYSGTLSKEKRAEITNEFIKNTKHMFNMYYERAAAADRLSGLTDREIMETVASSPTTIKRQARALLKKLKKYNIRLNQSGEVDFSGCSEPHIIKKLKNNPLVRVVLMQKDLEFEFPHREIQMEAARKAKAEFEESKAVREQEAKEREEEIKKEKFAEISASSEQSPFHQQYNIRYPQAELLVEEEVQLSAKEKAEEFSRLSTENLSAEATYRVFETYEERLARLEKKWLKNRLSALEGGIEKPTEGEKSELLDKAVEKMRRVKYLVEQKNIKQAGDLLFEEHKVFTTQQLMADEEVTAEKLYDYLNLPDEKRRIHAVDEIEDNKILNMIRRREVLEDSLKAYQENFAYRRTIEDTFDYKIERIDFSRHQKIGKSTSHKITEDDAYAKDDEEQTPGLISGDADLDVGGVSETGLTKGKVEKKKLMDYIKESTMKLASPETRNAQEIKKEETKKGRKGRMEAKKAKLAAEKKKK